MAQGYFLIFWVFSLVSHISSGLIPIKLDDTKGNKGNLEFAIQLPNNDTIEIGLSVQLLTISKSLDAEKQSNNNNTTTEPTIIDTTTVKPETKYVTVEEAIEGFRQELIKKENEIAGIIESDHPFYRHFKLEFEDDLNLTIRCTYISDYVKKSLSISCYEYHEYETERILSNGEVELVRLQDPNHKTEVELINARNVKQTYKMDIS